MGISGIGAISGSSPQIQKPAATGGGNVAQLEQQKKALQEEINRVKKDDHLQPEEKKKQLAMLAKELQRIEEALQKASAEVKEDDQTRDAAPTQETFAEDDRLLDCYA